MSSVLRDVVTFWLDVRVHAETNGMTDPKLYNAVSICGVICDAVSSEGEISQYVYALIHGMAIAAPQHNVVLYRLNVD